MIQNKEMLKVYLKADKEALGIRKKNVPFWGDEVWKFEIALRHMEYYLNCKKKGIGFLFWRWRYHKLGVLLGFHIPPNTCGKGLKISHSGCIIINDRARIGENCVIQQCVNIGRNHDLDDVPCIGNGVYIGPGAKLFGRIVIADKCAIGAGAVVTKSFTTPGVNIVGNPAYESGCRKEGLT